MAILPQRHMTSQPAPAWVRLARSGGVTLPTLTVTGIFGSMYRHFQVQVYDRRYDRQGLCMREIHTELTLPRSAVMVSAVQRRAFQWKPNDVRIRLPSSRAPAAWLKHITVSASLTEQHRESTYRYAGHSRGLRGNSVSCSPVSGA